MYEISLYLENLDGICFDEIGIDKSEIVEMLDGKKQCYCFYRDDIDESNLIKNKLLSIKDKEIKVHLKELKDSDWKTKWQEDVSIFKLTEKIRVIPAWIDEKVDIQLNDILIDTDLAFGIGTHPTTKCVSEFIEELNGEFMDFFDIGIGTGILSIVAAKYGAKRIWGNDISEEAIDTSIHNFKLNNISFQKLQACDFNDFLEKSQFDFVAANILTRYLLEFQDKIISYVRPGKYLAVSGVSTENYIEFKHKFNSGLLKILKEKEENGWHAVLYKRCT